MSIKPTDAHRKLAREIVWNDAQCRGLQPSAQLIADSEARAVEAALDEIPHIASQKVIHAKYSDQINTLTAFLAATAEKEGV